MRPVGIVTIAVASGFAACNASTATAEPPMVAGKYASMQWHICQTVIAQPKKTFKTSTNTNADAVTAIELVLNVGSPPASIISMSVGTVSFPSAPASSGIGSMSAVEIIGHSMRDGTQANNIGFARNTFRDSDRNFELTETTAKIGNVVWDMSAGDLQDGVARTINLVRRPKAGDYCLDAMTLTRK